MVGNDIVDINLAQQQSNWQRPRFLEKLFSQRERDRIYNSKTPFLMVWRLWSMKEAAYKLYTQLYPSRFYNPKGFECFIKGDSGEVLFKDFKCYVETKTSSNYIISEARLQPKIFNSEIVEFGSEAIQTNSIELRQSLLNAVSNKYDISEELTLKKNEYGTPSVYFNSKHIRISMTHHGKYGAFAIA
ncbi:MAG: 4-phosphopantetheinyl transferase family protein [Winogradskyella sp.]|uniref:4'-phosphopantetheinyl transferase family protein n=1 Tax=Winogradskyella sp. TaxID=1883156 RepID=UPI000F3CEFDA|nr:4'-phosphopantetheinyl transferase superfamily protein [Winogradskyella sp.]RNC88100.1 MAG: 4-phosphopantetheinyl transferase family protein [Winogradskyella sp.]